MHVVMVLRIVHISAGRGSSSRNIQTQYREHTQQSDRSSHYFPSIISYYLLVQDFDYLAAKTNGYSGSDIATARLAPLPVASTSLAVQMVRDALYEPIRKCQAATHFR